MAGLQKRNILLGKIIKLIRKTRGWTQAKLEEKSDTSIPYISKLENGKYKNPGIETIRTVAKGLGIRPAVLLVPEEFPCLRTLVQLQESIDKILEGNEKNTPSPDFDQQRIINELIHKMEVSLLKTIKENLKEWELPAEELF